MLEKLIEVLAALVAAINANTVALMKGAVASPEKPKKGKVETAAPAETPAGAPAPTVQDVRDAAKALLEATGNNDGGLFAKINQRLGIKKISEAPEDKRQEVIDEIKKATPAAKPAAEQI